MLVAKQQPEPCWPELATQGHWCYWPTPAAPRSCPTMPVTCTAAARLGRGLQPNVLAAHLGQAGLRLGEQLQGRLWQHHAPPAGVNKMLTPASTCLRICPGRRSRRRSALRPCTCGRRSRSISRTSSRQTAGMSGSPERASYPCTCRSRQTPSCGSSSPFRGLPARRLRLIDQRPAPVVQVHAVFHLLLCHLDRHGPLLRRVGARHRASGPKAWPRLIKRYVPPAPAIASAQQTRSQLKAVSEQGMGSTRSACSAAPRAPQLEVASQAC